MMTRTITAALSCLLIAWSASGAQAHELTNNTAQIALRDGHVTVVLQADVLNLIDALDLMPAPALTVVAMDDQAIKSLRMDAQRRLSKGARLVIDGKTIAIRVMSFPSAKAIKAAAHGKLLAPKGHPDHLTIQFEALDTAPDARRVSLSLPPELGTVVISFVQPRTQWTLPNRAAAFDVMEPVSSESAEAPEPPTPMFGSAALLALLGLLSVTIASTVWPRTQPD